MTPEFLSIESRVLEFFREAEASTGAIPRHASLDSFEVLAVDLAKLQFHHNTPFRRFCEIRGVHASTLANWKEIPAVPAAAFKEFEFSCLPPAERTTVFHSSGTTQSRPGRHFHNARSLKIYEASLRTWFKRHFAAALMSRKPAPAMLFLTPPRSAAPHSSLVYMFETLNAEFGAAPPEWSPAAQSGFAGRVASDGSWTLDCELVSNMLRTFSAQHLPVMVFGTAFSFVHLLDFAESAGVRLDLPAGSAVMETGGYKGRSRAMPKAELHDRLSWLFCLPRHQVVSEYGMSELSSQAYDCIVGQPAARPRRFQFPPWVRASVISPETGREVPNGEPGLLRIFDLANTYSVLALQTEDLALRHGEGFELLGRAALSEPRGCSLMMSGHAAETLE